MAEAKSEVGVVPISRKRVKECEESARFWTSELPRYADRKQSWADFWSILAGVLAAVTSLAIFPVLNDGSPDWAKYVVSGFAFVSAICALIPRVKGFAELSGQARELSSRYGGVVGDLLDLVEAPDPFPADAARAVVAEFESIKAKKDSLRGLTERQSRGYRRFGRSRPATPDEGDDGVKTG
jgi:hypothetical protein